MLKNKFFLFCFTEDVVADGSSVDTVLLVVGYVLCFGYALWSLGRYPPPFSVNNFVYGRAGLAVWGVIVVGMSTVAGFGMVRVGIWIEG